MSRYVIVALVPEPWASEIQKLRLEHDRWSRHWLPAHITIVPPFHGELSRTTIEAIENTNLPVRGEFTGWGRFTHDRSTTFWLEAGEAATRQARSGLLAAVPELERLIIDPPVDWAVQPSHHVTVVNHVPNPEADPLEAKLRTIDVNGPFEVSHLTVFIWDDRLGRWLLARPH